MPRQVAVRILPPIYHTYLLTHPLLSLVHEFHEEAMAAPSSELKNSRPVAKFCRGCGLRFSGFCFQKFNKLEESLVLQCTNCRAERTVIYHIDKLGQTQEAALGHLQKLLEAHVKHLREHWPDVDEKRLNDECMRGQSIGQPHVHLSYF